jgi:hypothetical protein
VTPAVTAASPVVQRAPEVVADEVRRDLAAVAVDDAGAIEPAAILTHPALLRRIAALLAVHVPATTDRLVAAVEDAPLVTALALHTGLPFVLVDTEPARPAQGELHPSEHVVTVSVLSPATDLTGAAEGSGAHVGFRLAVLADPRTDLTSLFDPADLIPGTTRKETAHG